MEIKNVQIFEGANIYSHNPVVEVEVDLERWDRIRSSDVPGFVQRLLAVLPGLREHHCSLGREGGFVERLEEGTYLGHVIEHVALELQFRSGSQVIYGRTRRQNDSIYQVVFEYEIREAGLMAARESMRLVSNIIMGESYDVESVLREMTRITRQGSLGPSTAAIVRAAEKRNIPCMRLDSKSLLQLGYGLRQKRVQATLTSNTSCIAVDTAADKVLTKKLLSDVGIPVPPGEVVADEKEAVEAWRQLGGPAVLKPVDGNQGKGVTLNLASEDEVLGAFRLARHYAEKVMVEKYVPGRHYRLLVVDGEMIAAAERTPAHVVGDGQHTVSQLIDLANLDPRRGEGHEKPLTRLRVDPVVLMNLARRNLTLNYVPAAGEPVFLRDNANLSTGGTAIDVTDSAHENYRQMAVRAVRTVGLDVGGVDLVAIDIARPRNNAPESGSVIEVNAAPGLRMHVHPSSGSSRDAGGAIVRYLFPYGDAGRIPLVAVTGTNGKTTVTRLVAHLLARVDTTVGVATSDGAFVGDDLIVPGDATGPDSARAILRDQRTEAAVLETARGGIIRGGLAYDQAHVSVVTNIGTDHLGQDGVETVRDLLRVKSLVVERTAPDGWAVLNASDPLALSLADRCPGRLALFSTVENDLRIKKGLARGGRAAYVDKGRLVLGRGGKSFPLVRLDEVPITMGGLASHNVENILAASLVGWLLGIKPAGLAKGLREFEDNPGRFNLYRLGPGRVLVDYAHNVGGYQAVLGVARDRMAPGRLLGVVGVPGDRRDRDIVAAGHIAGEYLDRAYVKEDADLRGRRPREVADLLVRGLIQGGMGEEDICVITDEEECIMRAVSGLREDDLLVIFYEKLEGTLKVLGQSARNRGWELKPEPVARSPEARSAPPTVQVTGKPNRGVE